MKKIFSTLIISLFFFSSSIIAQENSLDAPDDFIELLSQMKKELTTSKTVGSYEMLQNLQYKVDDELAHKYLLNGNQFVKVEDSECYPIGYILNKSDGIATLFFYRGSETSLFYLIEVVTYNIKKGKVIDQLTGVAAFAKQNSVCRLFVKNLNLTELTTISGLDETKLELKVNNKGKIDRN